MAVDGPGLDDGFALAGIDFRDSTFTGTTHLGPNGSLQYSAVRLSTLADHTVLGCTVAGQLAYGIIQNKPSTGEAADVRFLGISKAIAGATSVVAGLDLMVDASGYLVAYASGATVARFGRAITTPAAVGEIFTAAIYGFGAGGGSIA